jgi:hypothetical protein
MSVSRWLNPAAALVSCASYVLRTRIRLRIVSIASSRFSSSSVVVALRHGLIAASAVRCNAAYAVAARVIAVSAVCSRWYTAAAAVELSFALVTNFVAAAPVHLSTADMAPVEMVCAAFCREDFASANEATRSPIPPASPEVSLVWSTSGFGNAMVSPAVMSRTDHLPVV